MHVVVPVSIGEALDKLSILHIKLDKIEDDYKLEDIKKEISLLGPCLSSFFENRKIKNQFNKLCLINTIIWEKVDTVRDGKTSDPIVLLENDARYRIKTFINNIADSDIKEHKNLKNNEINIVATNIENDVETILNATIYYDKVNISIPSEKVKIYQERFCDEVNIVFIEK